MSDDVPVLPAAPERLLLCKLLLAETITPWRKNAYRQDVAAISMQAMRACIENRLARPDLFGAPGATSWTDIIGAPGQFKGFHRKDGTLQIAGQVQQRLDQILNVDVHRSETIGKAMRAFVRLAVNTAEAAANPDPFANLPEFLGSGRVQVMRGTYGWRTFGHPMLGPVRFVLIPASLKGVLLANQFYTMTRPRPSATSFWTAYLNYDTYSATQAWAKVGPTLGDTYKNANSCAARVSYGLNYGGFEIESAPQFETNLNNDKKRYIISATKMRAYLRHHWGKPDLLFPGGGVQTLEALRKHLTGGKVAIVAYDGHIGVVTTTYNDSFTPDAPDGDAWIVSP